MKKIVLTFQLSSWRRRGRGEAELAGTEAEGYSLYNSGHCQDIQVGIELHKLQS